MNHLVYGSRELGRCVKHLLGECRLPFSGYIDDINRGPDIIGPFESIQREYSPGEFSIINAVGYKNLQARQNVTEKIINSGYTLTTVIHPAAYVAQDAVVGAGCIIMAHAVIDTNVKLGDNVVVWPGCVINHDSEIGGNTFLSPNATICGGVIVGNNCFIGAGSVIAEHRKMQAGSFLGALKIWK